MGGSLSLGFKGDSLQKRPWFPVFGVGTFFLGWVLKLARVVGSLGVYPTTLMLLGFFSSYGVSLRGSALSVGIRSGHVPPVQGFLGGF